MAKIISIHSFRGGTGKSNMTANLAALLAAEGGRVGVIDTDIQSPGIHVLFGLQRRHDRPLAQRLPVGSCADPANRPPRERTDRCQPPGPIVSDPLEYSRPMRSSTCCAKATI